MSLDKAIASGKEHRKPFRKSARFDPSCRNGSGNPCPYCEGNRTIRNRRVHERIKAEMATVKEYDDDRSDDLV